MTRTGRISVRITKMLLQPIVFFPVERHVIRTESIYVRVITMLPQLVTRTESTSVRAIRMLPQLVCFFPVERACKSYRRYICENNKDAASANWL
jgi:hypothetical protein